MGSTLVGEPVTVLGNLGNGVRDGDGDGNLLALRALFSAGIRDGSQSSPLMAALAEENPVFERRLMSVPSFCHTSGVTCKLDGQQDR